MDIKVPEREKVEGVCYAVTSDGIELPVIDITHPRFFCDPTPDEMSAVVERTIRNFERWEHAPRFLLWLMARRSVIVRDVNRAAGGYLAGVATYIQKLGPENLGAGWATDIDRRLAHAMGPLSMRWRLRHLAMMLADEVRAGLAAGRRRSIAFLNVAGGTAVDSINALLLLARSDPELLAGRRVTVFVLDPDRDAAAFGARAIAALRSDGGGLAGADVRLEQVDYDWRNTARLAEIVGGIPLDDAVLVCSSEGGLFEYGSDEEIAQNLAALGRLAPGVSMAGTLLLDGVGGRAMVKYGRVPLQPRTVERFRAIVERAGWCLSRVAGDNPVYAVVRMTAGEGSRA